MTRTVSVIISWIVFSCTAEQALLAWRLAGTAGPYST